jgi:hypothetical protein
MNRFSSKKWTHIFSILCILAVALPPLNVTGALSHDPPIQYHDIITSTIEQVHTIWNQQHIDTLDYLQTLSRELEQQPLVSATMLCKGSISVEFMDGYQLVLLSPTSSGLQQQTKARADPDSPKAFESPHSALILHPFAQVYGSRQCRIIKRILTLQDIPVVYYENQAVDLKFIEENLSTAIIYYNTHAGFWDINTSNQTETVVIATGEKWTNDTITKYSYEYSHQFIVEGVVGTTSYVAFTPALIEYYYNDTAFTDSFIYMATCHAVYDDSMASVFLDKGAAVYLSWTKDTVFWTNSLSSIWTFRLLSLGVSIASICDIIGYGGFYNWLFDSTLSYLGDGSYTLK